MTTPPIETGDFMYHIQSDHQTEIIIKKSRFITYLHRCEQEADAKEYMRQIRKEHPKASHHCYAMILGNNDEIQRSNDDGEPSGTAGMPMLEVLHQNQIQDILAITVRYFGGIKLGTGGLVRAYSSSVAQALKEAIITQRVRMQKCRLRFSYDMIGKMDHFFRKEQIEIIDKDYGEQITYTFLCDSIPEEAISELSSGAYHIEWLEEIMVDVRVSDLHP